MIDTHKIPQYKATITNRVEMTCKFYKGTADEILNLFTGPYLELIEQEMHDPEFSLTVSSSQGAIIVRRIADKEVKDPF